MFDDLGLIRVVVWYFGFVFDFNVGCLLVCDLAVAVWFRVVVFLWLVVCYDSWCYLGYALHRFSLWFGCLFCLCLLCLRLVWCLT